jgi:hypothetical protein
MDSELEEGEIEEDSELEEGELVEEEEAEEALPTSACTPPVKVRVRATVCITETWA